METSTFPIKYWAEDDRPREKLLLKGSSALSDAELIAILLGSGSRNESAVELSRRLLSSTENKLEVLGKLSFKQLTSFKGIGEAKGLTVIAALELGKRRNSEPNPELTKITSSRTVFELMLPLLGDLPHEEFWVIYLNNSNKILHKTQISKGGITGTVVDTRIIFKIALEQYATSVILTHNHPSGTLKPSEADRQITRKLKAAGGHLDIAVLDHIIITESGYFSFADEGIL